MRGRVPGKIAAMTRAVVLALAVIVALAITARDATAQGFFSSSPGPLAQSHAQWDNQNGCKDCHVNDSKDL